jgi:RNA polymerase sporulation-specific sigma factor
MEGDACIRATLPHLFSVFPERGLAVANKVKPEVMPMMAAAWLMLSSLLYGLQLQTGSFPKPLTEEEERHYLALAAQGDLDARNTLIERNLRLVAHIMKKYYAQTSDQEDLISIGTIGLIKGVTTFDGSKGARLATYAARCVENEILMYFRSQRKSAQDVSLSDYIETETDGAALSLMDVVSEDSDLLEQVSARESVQQLRRCLNTCLTDQERQVISLRYGLDGEAPKRQREVAGITGISRSYVSRIEKRALEKLRMGLEA